MAHGPRNDRCAGHVPLRTTEREVNSNGDAGITIQDALFNGVITLIVLAALVAVYFVAHNQHEQNEAAQDFSAIVAGAKSANGANTDYYAFTFAQQKAQGDLPTQDSVDSQNNQKLIVPWLAGEPYMNLFYDIEGMDITVPFTNVGMCVAVTNAVISGMTLIGNDATDSGITPSKDYYYGGAWQTDPVTNSPWTPQTACADAINSPGMDYFFR